MATETAAVTAQTRTPAKTQIGLVVSDKRNKTITVEVRRVVKHARYGKYLYRSTLYHAHDEKEEAKTGDRVEIQACRPISKQKRWSLVRIIEKATTVDVQVKDVEIPLPDRKPAPRKSESSEGAGTKVEGKA
jgi:small subunit ribosomal protein S17